MNERDELAPLEDALGARDAPAILWWRDDDAGRPHPHLDRLLGLARDLQVPVALAVVPAWLEPDVAGTILATAEATVLQHGFAHEDHAAPGERRIELGGCIDRGRLRAQLREGAVRLEAAFGRRFERVLVPPWNRIAVDVVRALPALGYRALSTWDEGDLGPMPEGLGRLDVHVDPIDWRGGRRWLGLAATARRLADRLTRVRGPVGLVTHHRVMGEEAWRDLDRLLALLRGHPRARLMAVGPLIRGEG